MLRVCQHCADEPPQAVASNDEEAIEKCVERLGQLQSGVSATSVVKTPEELQPAMGPDLGGK